MLEFGAIFSLKTFKECGTVTHCTGEFENTVLDSGLSRMGVGVWIDRCAVGSSGVAVMPTQTALQAFVASTTTDQTTTTGINTAENFFWCKRVWRFSPRGSNTNLSEVGSGWDDGSMWNRALIKDINGSPTTLTWLGDEYLDVSEEIRVYMRDSTGTIELKNPTTGAVISTHNVSVKQFYDESQMDFMAGKLAFGRIFYYSDKGMPESPTVSVPSLSGAKAIGTATTYPTSNSMSCTLSTELADTVSVSCAQVAISNIFSNSNLGNAFKFSVTPPITQTTSEQVTLSFSVAWGRVT